MIETTIVLHTEMRSRNLDYDFDGIITHAHPFPLSFTPPFVLYATHQWRPTPRKLREVVAPTTLSGKRIRISSNGVVTIAVPASSSLPLSYYSRALCLLCV